jgi:hypothetical protein
MAKTTSTGPTAFSHASSLGKEKYMRSFFGLIALGLVLASPLTLFGQTGAAAGAGTAAGTATANGSSGMSTIPGGTMSATPNTGGQLNPNGGVNANQRFATPFNGANTNANSGTGINPNGTNANGGIGSGQRMSSSNMSGPMNTSRTQSNLGPGSANGVAGQIATPNGAMNPQVGANATTNLPPGTSGIGSVGVGTAIRSANSPNVGVNTAVRSANSPNVGVNTAVRSANAGLNGNIVSPNANVGGTTAATPGTAATATTATGESFSSLNAPAGVANDPNGPTNPNINATGQANSGLGSVNGQVTGTANTNAQNQASGGVAAPNTDASANIGSVNGQQTQPLSRAQNTAAGNANSWRMVNQNGRWWYWAPGNYWMGYDGATWTRYNQPAAVPLSSSPPGSSSTNQ